MAKSDRDRANQIVNQDSYVQAQLAQDEIEHERARRNEAQGRADETYNLALGGYSNFANTGGLSAEDMARLRPDWMVAAANGETPLTSGEIGGGGYAGSLQSYTPDFSAYSPIEQMYRNALSGNTIDTGRLRAAAPTLEEMSRTGGYNNNQLESIGQSLGLLKGMGATGGLDPVAMSRMTGAGHFDNMAQTGGMNERDIANVRNRANSAIPALYDASKRAINSSSRITGNIGPGAAALQARMGRDSARELAASTRDTELAILRDQIENKKWGASNIASSEQAMQRMRTENMMNALNSSLGFEADFGGQIADRRMTAAKNLSEMELPIQAMLQDERRYGATNLTGLLDAQQAARMGAVNAYNSAVAGSHSSANAAASAAAAARAKAQGQLFNNDWDITEYRNRNQLTGLGGIAGLNEGANAQIAHYNNSIGNNTQAAHVAAQNAAGNLAAMNPSPMDRITDIVGMGANIGAGLLTGLGGGSPEEERRRRGFLED